MVIDLAALERRILTADGPTFQKIMRGIGIFHRSTAIEKVQRNPAAAAIVRALLTTKGAR